MVLGDHPKKVEKKDKFIVETSQKSKEILGLFMMTLMSKPSPTLLMNIFPKKPI